MNSTREVLVAARKRIERVINSYTAFTATLKLQDACHQCGQPGLYRDAYRALLGEATASNLSGGPAEIGSLADIARAIGKEATLALFDRAIAAQKEVP
jgi:hypothetical protein